MTTSKVYRSTATALVLLALSVNAINTRDVTAKILSRRRGPPHGLLGTARDMAASASDLAPGVHPRILFSRTGWEDIVDKYAAKRTVSGSWSSHFLNYVVGKGPGNPQILKWVNLDTSAYTGNKGMNKAALEALADEVEMMSEYNEGGFFMYALHAAVNEKTIASTGSGYLLPGQTTDAAITLIVNYAKIVLAHYATYGCSWCEYKKGPRRSDLWNTKGGWGVHMDWYTGGLGIALSYDVLYHRMSVDQRRFVRSAIGVMVKDREHWGITTESTRFSPNAEKHPHRIFGNWATYHANLYLTNLAIEGETDFDYMTTNASVPSNASVGFNPVINRRTVALYDAFMKHSIYPDGSTFEDGYIYNLGLREGSLGFVALARRGHNHLDTPRFRNFIVNAAAMHEPYRCGQLVGHASGGGQLYPTFYALARYAYPAGALSNMLWRQRMGGEFRDNSPCRITFHQVMMQLAVLGGEHAGGAESPAGLTGDAARAFPLALYTSRRGLLMARASLAENALYMHFDARPDAFLPGHDNADRGEITLTALRRTWLDALHWYKHSKSQSHSLVHIDGQAQAVKAPSVRMLKVLDNGEVVLAAADLTYAYNVQWSRPWAAEKPPSFDETVWTNGVAKLERVTLVDKELGNPRSFGWPENDRGRDLGFRARTSLWGEPDIGFSGLYTWKREYRQTRLAHAVRSTVLVRKGTEVGYAVLGDDFAMNGSGTHVFESYLVLASGVSVLPGSGCTGRHCKISLSGGSGKQLDVHASILGGKAEFRVDSLGDTNSRLVIVSKGRRSEQFCIAFHPHVGVPGVFQMFRTGNVCSVQTGTVSHSFEFSTEDHSLFQK